MSSIILLLHYYNCNYFIIIITLLLLHYFWPHWVVYYVNILILLSFKCIMFSVLDFWFVVFLSFFHCNNKDPGDAGDALYGTEIFQTKYFRQIGHFFLLFIASEENFCKFSVSHANFDHFSVFFNQNFANIKKVIPQRNPPKVFTKKVTYSKYIREMDSWPRSYSNYWNSTSTIRANNLIAELQH